MLAVGIDLGGTKLLAALVDERGAILERHEVPTQSERGPAAVVANMASLARTVAGKAKGPVMGVGVGAPGPIDPKNGSVYDMPNMGSGWKRFPLRVTLRA